MSLAMFASPMFAQSRHPNAALCMVRNLPTEVPANLNALSIESHMFISGPNSTAELRVRNVSPKSIIAIELLLEYYGSNGERFGDVIADAIARQIPDERAFPILKRMKGGGAAEITDVISPGGTASVRGLGLFATAICPVRARLTAARLWFSDGASLDWSAPDSRLILNPMN
ncbi:MAG: hypothetical protein WBE20_07155 [Candidatus Acidiferrales bacterium]